MDIVVWLVLGLAAGVLALLAMYRTFPRDAIGWLGALVVGVLGGLLGGWLANLIGLRAANWVGAIVIAFVGAAIILWLLRRTTGRTV
jgi:uncharacterized membrane protein YeaQ/YmgE (transglycosylase-associated protein family)